MSARAIVSILVGIMIAACRLDARELSSAEVTRFERGQSVQTWSLGKDQVRDLTAWFAANRDGWTPSAVSYAPGVEVRMLHLDGSRSVLNLRDPLVILYSNNGQVTQSFDAAGIAALKLSLGLMP